jgi:CHAD domain-containing protein
VSRPPLTTRELALQVLRQHAAALAAHAAAARAGEDNDPEQVRQMRVPTRRMHGAIRLLRDVLPPAAAGLNGEVRWIASQLGPLRDLDVQAHRLVDNATCLGVADAVAPVCCLAGTWLEAEGQRAMSAIADVFASERFEQLSQLFADLDAELDADTERGARRGARTPATSLPSTT